MRLVAKVVMVLCLLTMSSHALGQTTSAAADTVAIVMRGQLSVAEKSVMEAAEAMPEETYGFAPSAGEFSGVRTFAQQVKHIAVVNYNFGSTILQGKPPVLLGGSNGPDSVKTKAEILQFARESFTYLHKAFDSITAQNMLEPIKFGPTNTTRLRLAAYGVAHPFDHYGQMVEYLRMNGIVPPASRPPAAQR